MVWKDVQDGQDVETVIIGSYPKNSRVKPRSGKFKLNIKKDGQCLQVGSPCTKPCHGFKQNNSSCMVSL